MTMSVWQFLSVSIGSWLIAFGVGFWIAHEARHRQQLREMVEDHQTEMRLVIDAMLARSVAELKRTRPHTPGELAEQDAMRERNRKAGELPGIMKI